MLILIELGQNGIDQANDLIEKGENRISISDVNLLAPISRPNKILAVGLNYKDHIVLDKNLVRPSEVDTLLANYDKAKKKLNISFSMNRFFQGDFI